VVTRRRSCKSRRGSNRRLITAVYRLALANYRQFQDGQSKRRDLPGADKVARVVAELAACEHMPLRVRVGLDARLLSLVRGILPTPCCLALKHRIFRR
jgi:hypothetical protein